MSDPSSRRMMVSRWSAVRERSWVLDVGFLGMAGTIADRSEPIHFPSAMRTNEVATAGNVEHETHMRRSGCDASDDIDGLFDGLLGRLRIDEGYMQRVADVVHPLVPEQTFSV